MLTKNSILLLISFLFIGSVLFIGCKKKEGEEKTVISIKGSDTMVNLAQKWAEVYMQKNPNVSIQVTGGGSGTGVAALLNGTTDLANASRELKDSELETAKEKGITPVTYEVALDGISSDDCRICREDDGSTAGDWRPFHWDLCFAACRPM